MKKWGMVLLCALILGGAIGCRSDSGSREYVPGRGWQPVR
jgi:hypothetical protein